MSNVSCIYIMFKIDLDALNPFIGFLLISNN